MLNLLNAVGRAFWSPVPYLSWAVISALLAVSGPFGTFDRMTFSMRVEAFALVVGLCIVWGVSARAVIQQILPKLGFWSASLLVIAFSSVVLAVPVRGLVWGFAGPGPSGSPGLPVVAALIICFGLSVALLRWMVTQRETARITEAATITETAPPATAALPRLVERLPTGVQGALIRVSGQNHYVEIATDKGSARVLLRLSDALAELGDIDGAQVHRSHWVAAQAVVSVERDGPKQLLVLTDGSRIPVGRRYQQGAERLAQLRPRSGTAQTVLPVSSAIAPSPINAENAASSAIRPPV